MTRLLVFLLLFLAFRVEAKPWYAPQYADSGAIQIWNTLEYFSSNSNYDTGGGSFEKLPNGGTYKLLDWKVAARYYFSKQLSAWSGFGLANAKSNDGSFSRNNTSLTEWSSGAHYRLRYGNWRIIPEGIFSVPLKTYSDTTDEVMNSEGVMSAEPAVWGSYQFGIIKPYARIGLKYRAGGRSSLATWLMGADFKLATFTLGADIGGYETISDDTDVNDSTVRDATSLRVNAGSNKFYAINPSLLEVQAFGEGYITQSLFARAGIAKTVNGKNNAEGIALFASIGWEIGKVAPTSNDDSMAKKQPFEVYEGDYDADLFKTPTTPEGSATAPAGQTKKSHKKGLTIDQMIKETEKEIEQK